MKSVAGAGENIYRVLQTLPGVAAVNDFDSRLSVRGGGPDQNLTMMDGVEIHNPYRLFGLTSAFNPETVANFELITGGFNAQYGDRLSSILIVDNRPGSTATPIGGTAALSMTDANIVAEGRLPGMNGSSWLVTGRSTYYDLVAERIVDADLPSFADLQARVDMQIKPGHRLSLSALSSRESTDARFDDDDENPSDEFVDVLTSTQQRSRRADLLGDASARARSARPSSPGTGIEELIDFSGDVRTGSRRSNRPADEDAEPLTADRIQARQLSIRDAGRAPAVWCQCRNVAPARSRLRNAQPRHHLAVAHVGRVRRVANGSSAHKAAPAFRQRSTPRDRTCARGPGSPTAGPSRRACASSPACGWTGAASTARRLRHHGSPHCST